MLDVAGRGKVRMRDPKMKERERERKAYRVSFVMIDHHTCEAMPELLLKIFFLPGVLQPKALVLDVTYRVKVFDIRVPYAEAGHASPPASVWLGVRVLGVVAAPRSAARRWTTTAVA